MWFTHTLHKQGALYASPTTDDAPSTILYRPFAPWASNSDWMMQLPRPEQAICVAAGAHFCAVATDAGWLRLWSEGGAQLHVSSLPGPVVAMAANDALLAVVTAAAVQSTSDMALHYTVWCLSVQFVWVVFSFPTWLCVDQWDCCCYH